MKKLNTFEQLDAFLDEELSWREKELSLIKTLIEKNKKMSASSSPMLNYLLRSGIALLYAHWEGIVKEAAIGYLCFVSVKGLSYRQLATNFVALGMKQRLIDAGKTHYKASVHNEITEYFVSGMREKSDLPWENREVVDTKGNLKLEVFREIIHMLGLEYRAEYQTKEKLIDETLLKNRNNIAHGRRLETVDVDVDSYIDLHENVIILMELFCTQIRNAASMEAYKRKPK